MEVWGGDRWGRCGGRGRGVWGGGARGVGGEVWGRVKGRGVWRGGGGEAGALSGVCSDRREARSRKEAEYWALVCLFTAGSYVTSVVMSPSVHYGISYQLSDVSIHCRIIISFFILSSHSISRISHQFCLYHNFVCKLVGSADISPSLYDFHWLPISSRIQYKIALICFHIVPGTGPPYLSELLHLYSPSRSLRSSSDSRIFHILRMGRRTRKGGGGGARGGGGGGDPFSTSNL